VRTTHSIGMGGKSGTDIIRYTRQWPILFQARIIQVDLNKELAKGVPLPIFSSIQPSTEPQTEEVPCCADAVTSAGSGTGEGSAHRQWSFTSSLRIRNTYDS